MRKPLPPVAEPQESRIHNAYLEACGTAPNVVQARAVTRYAIRSTTLSGMRALNERVQAIARGAALMTGTKVDISIMSEEANMQGNTPLEEAMQQAMDRLGGVPFDDTDRAYAARIQATLSDEDIDAEYRQNGLLARKGSPLRDYVVPADSRGPAMMGSTDVADVSWAVPTVQARVATHAIGTPGHSWQITAQGKAGAAHKGMIHAAKIMGDTARMLMADKDPLARVKQDHRRRMEVEPYVCPIPEDVTPPLILFRNQTFRSLWIAALASNFGGLVQAFGAAWLMTSLSDSQNMVALVQGSAALPIMIFSLLAGVFADNFDRRRVMLIAQSFMFCVSVLLTFMAFEGWLTPWLLLAFTFSIGCGTALHNPSWQATMGDIVTREELPSAVSLNSMGFNLMRSIGPAAGGAIVALAGAAAAFAVNALSYVAIILALLRWKAPVRDMRLPREPMGNAFSAGLRYVAMSPNLMRVILRGFWFGLSAIALLALLPVVVREILQGTAFVYGLMLGCFGMGAVVGALLNARLRARFANEMIARGGFTGFAFSCAGLAFSTQPILSGIALMLAGACGVLSMPPAVPI